MLQKLDDIIVRILRVFYKPIDLSKSVIVATNLRLNLFNNDT